MKKETILMIAEFVFAYFMIMQICATLTTTEYENRLNFGHILLVRNISTTPNTLTPGEPSVLSMIVENTGNEFVNDIVVTFNSTDEIGLINDISQRKIAKLESGGAAVVSFDIIAMPNVAEGVYSPEITVNYVNHVGEERTDSGEIGLAVKASPTIFAKAETSEIYGSNKIGAVTITFVNNDIADMKFLTVELEETEDYKVIGSNKEYIGDLDSDDFESVDFRLSIKSKRNEIVLQLKISYTDAMNNKKSEEIETILKIFSAKELGVKTNGTISSIFITIISAGILFYIYKRYKKKKKQKELKYS